MEGSKKSPLASLLSWLKRLLSSIFLFAKKLLSSLFLFLKRWWVSLLLYTKTLIMSGAVVALYNFFDSAKLVPEPAKPFIAASVQFVISYVAVSFTIVAFNYAPKINRFFEVLFFFSESPKLRGFLTSYRELKKLKGFVREQIQKEADGMHLTGCCEQEVTIQQYTSRLKSVVPSIESSVIGFTPVRPARIYDLFKAATTAAEKQLVRDYLCCFKEVKDKGKKVFRVFVLNDTDIAEMKNDVDSTGLVKEVAWAKVFFNDYGTTLWAHEKTLIAALKRTELKDYIGAIVQTIDGDANEHIMDFSILDSKLLLIWDQRKAADKSGYLYTIWKEHGHHLGESVLNVAREAEDGWTDLTSASLSGFGVYPDWDKLVAEHNHDVSPPTPPDRDYNSIRNLETWAKS